MIESFLNSLYVVFNQMSPFLLFGFLMAGIFSVVIPKEMVQTHLGKNKIWSVIKASCFGVPLPLCSCSVIPVAASIKNKGASHGATTAFLISTPQTGVDSILVSYAMLGPVFAFFTPIAAFISGTLGGTLVQFFTKEPKESPSIQTEQTCQSCCSSSSCKQNAFYKIFKYGFVEIPTDLAKPLLIGIILAAFISTVVPKDFFSGYLGTGISGMFIMMLFGIPLYVCATASIPIAAALLAKGVDPGAVFVFLMSGPATNAATLSTVWKLMGRNTLVIYLISIIICAFSFGLLLNTINIIPASATISHEHTENIDLLNLLSSIALLIIFFNVFLSSVKTKLSS